MANHYGNHKCHLEKYIPIVFILPSRWQDDAESLGIETASCLFHKGTEWFFKNKNTEQLTLTTRKNDSTNPLQCSSLSPCCLKQRRSAKTTTRTTKSWRRGGGRQWRFESTFHWKIQNFYSGSQGSFRRQTVCCGICIRQYIFFLLEIERASQQRKFTSWEKT